MDTITIQGHEFEVPVPYAEGHVLKANEAKALNQTYHEALRNNFARVVKAKIKEVFGKESLDEEESLSADALAALQAELNEYEKTFEFNVRARGPATPRDPVLAEALRSVRKIIRDSIKAQGGDVKDYDEDSLEELAKRLIDEDPKYLVAARNVVEQRQAIAAERIVLPPKSAA